MTKPTYLITPDLSYRVHSTGWHNHDRVYIKRTDCTELKDHDIEMAAKGTSRDTSYRVISRDTFTVLVERDHYIGE